MKCPKCQRQNPEDAKFCNECACSLQEISTIGETTISIEGERKHATIMFSDISGYTKMTESLDPEEVKDILSLVFAKMNEIIKSYDGFVEKYIGDAVMAVFGVPIAHEDDPIRAIRAAIEMNAEIEALNPQLEDRIGQPLTLHTGINTGLIVTGEVDVNKGTHGLAGDAINLASRLQGIAKAGEIIVGPETYNQAQNHFVFETLNPTMVKGKTKPVSICKLIATKEMPDKLHRIKGVKAELIGRDKEIATLLKAAEHLQKGYGSLVQIIGDAGTGKSRLLQDFKEKLNLDNITWHEGHAYGFMQNSPYFPLVDLFTRSFRIEEGDGPENIKKKLESGLAILMGQGGGVAPYIGGLFSIQYPETVDLSPESWKSKLYKSVSETLKAIANQGPTIVCFEDLHWADPSTVEMLRHLVPEFSEGVLFLSTYRPPFRLLAKTDKNDSTQPNHHEICLTNLNGANVNLMLHSLLKTESVPKELIDFVRIKAEGNPFYLEEMVNSLIESNVVVNENGHWRVCKAISEADIPTTIQGVLSARVDRLDFKLKRIIQEASVIGRIFLYKIIRKISDTAGSIDQYLSELEELDLIRMQSVEPELEYLFKHALTQEVVYHGLLKKERQEIHERIGMAIEHIFSERLPEFYEVLAHHFSEGKSIRKAFDYLLKSGKKSFEHYSLKEAHVYFQKAYKIIKSNSANFQDDEELLSRLLFKWAITYNQRGDFNGLIDLLTAHEDLIIKLNNKELLCLFYAWIGWAYERKLLLKESHQYLKKALELAKGCKDEKITTAVCTYLIWTCADLGLLVDALEYSDRVRDGIHNHELEQQVYQLFWCGVAWVHWFKGESDKCIEAGNILLESGLKNSDNRKLTLGYIAQGWGFNAKGDQKKAINSFEKAAEIAIDPQYYCDAKIMLGFSHIADGNVTAAEAITEEMLIFNKQYGFDFMGEAAKTFDGVISLAKGEFQKGLNVLKKAEQRYINNGAKVRVAWQNQLLGRFYLKFVEGGGSISMNSIIKNSIFFLKTIPLAGRKAKHHLEKAIEISNQIGAGMILGPTMLDLGYLYRLKKNSEMAEKYFQRSIKIFRELNNDIYLKKAEGLLKEIQDRC
jgi:class 3 adenylate cyclase/tetratricopeptide (TPR) repeat protein